MVMDISELKTIYNEMDTEGRKGMIIAAKKLLDVQKTLESTNTGNENKIITFGIIKLKLRSKQILGYFASVILLIILTFIFWNTLISSALLNADISPLIMLRIIATALAGLILVGSGLVDFIQRKTKAPWRVIIITAGLACAEPGILTDLIGIALLAFIASVQIVQWKKEKTAIFT
jgi:hypothetical protein